MVGHKGLNDSLVSEGSGSITLAVVPDRAMPATVTGPVLLTVKVRADHVAVVTIDDGSRGEGASLNTITRAFMSQLSGLVERLRDDPGIVAAVLTSGKEESFVVGANIQMLQKLRFAADGERMSLELARGFSRLRTLGKPVVAAIHGQALGGGFELALACTAIVLSDDRATAVGLPEVKLGLLSGGNGLLRLAERAGLQVALDLGLTGRSIGAGAVSGARRKMYAAPAPLSPPSKRFFAPISATVPSPLIQYSSFCDCESSSLVLSVCS